MFQLNRMYFAVRSKHPFENMKLISFEIFLSFPWNKMLAFFPFWLVEMRVNLSGFLEDSVKRLILEANFVFFWKMIKYRWHLLIFSDLLCQRFKPKATDFVHLPLLNDYQHQKWKREYHNHTIISFSLYFIIQSLFHIN